MNAPAPVITDITIDRKTLQAALAAVKPMVDTRSPLIALTCVMLEVSPVGLTIAATNLEAYTIVTIPLDFDTRTACSWQQWLTPWADLAAAVKDRSSSFITLAPPYVHVGGTTYTLQAMAPDEYPARPHRHDLALPPAQPVTVRGDTFRAALARTLPAVSTDQARPILNGVHVRQYPDNYSVCLEAADGYRLHRACLSSIGAIPHDLGLTIPLATCRAILHTTSQILTLDQDRNSEALWISGDNEVIVSGLVPGTYPNVDQLFPIDPPARYAAPASAWIAALSPHKGKNTLAVALNPTAGTLITDLVTLTSKDEDREVITRLPAAQLSDDCPTLKYDPRYLLDVFSAIKDCPHASLAARAGASPALIVADKDPAYFSALVMPMYLPD